MQIVVLAGLCLAIFLSPPHAQAQEAVALVSATSGRQTLDQDRLALINRLTWGITIPLAKDLQRQGSEWFLDAQLTSGQAAPPLPVQARIDQMEISRIPVEQLIYQLRREQQEVNKSLPGENRENRRKLFQQHLNQLANEAAQRSVLTALYSQHQLQEKMTWFWMNHFNVYIGKNAYMRALTPDYESKAIRPRALGNFRDLLLATMQHPAMLLYLDNHQNRVGQVNENYARELLELHTLGVDGGYTQADVEALTRILTGLGVNLTGSQPKITEENRRYYIRQGVFEFNPDRHDFTVKTFLGNEIAGAGLQEISRVADILAKHPATARHISRKLAIYFVGDEPSDTLVKAMSQTFLKSQGNIASILRTMLEHPEFQRSLVHDNFKDPMRYVLACVRLLHSAGPPIVNAQAIVAWLRQLGQPLYGRETPDGYPLQRSAWQGSGQMIARFNVARAIGSGNSQFFQEPGQSALPSRPAPSDIRKAYHPTLLSSLSDASRDALARARNLHEWNTLLLSSPEFMNQ